jgi:hypothetical protein
MVSVFSAAAGFPEQLIGGLFALRHATSAGQFARIVPVPAWEMCGQAPTLL